MLQASLWDAFQQKKCHQHSSGKGMLEGTLGGFNTALLLMFPQEHQRCLNLPKLLCRCQDLGQEATLIVIA